MVAEIKQEQINEPRKSVISDILGSRYFRLGVALTISTISLYLATRQVSWTEAWKVVAQVRLGWAALAVLSVIINVLAKIVRWKLLASGSTQPVSFGRLTKAFLVGQMLNNVYPARVGDLGRAYAIGDRADERVFMFGTIILEKVIDIAAYSLIAVCMVLLVPMPWWINGSVVGLAVMGVVVVTALGIVWWLRKHPAKSSNPFSVLLQRLSTYKLGAKLVEWLKIGSASVDVLASGKVILGVLATTIFVWATALLNNLLVMQAIDLGLDLPGDQAKAAMVILVGLTAGIKIPAPGQIGIFEYICVLSLGLFQVPQAAALTYGILLHMVVFLPPTLGGLVSMVVFGAEGKKDNKVKRTGPLEILGVQMESIQKEGLINRVLSWVDENRKATVFYVNAHCLNIATKDEAYRELLNHADLVYVDGVGVAWAGRFLAGIDLYKVTGRAWIDDFCRMCQDHGVSLYLLGGKPGIAKQAQANLQNKYRQLLITGSSDGYFQDKGENEVLKELQTLQPDVLLVGMGVPLQEKWIDAQREMLPVKVCWGVGALFDYVAGAEKPVPVVMERLSLEWLWRLFVDPRGKWRRYLLGMPEFIGRVIWQKLNG